VFPAPPTESVLIDTCYASRLGFANLLDDIQSSDNLAKRREALVVGLRSIRARKDAAVKGVRSSQASISIRWIMASES
jgi:hypothetical protein